MPAFEVITDAEELTVTVTADFEAMPGAVWEAWADRRKLERWWARPGWIAEFEDHDFRSGGRARYRLVGPGGAQARGWWQICAVDAPHRLEFEDGTTDENGHRATEFGVSHVQMRLAERGTGARMVLLTTFASVDQIDQMMSAGVADHARRAVGRIADLLGE
ncbi:SRPBCC family protein [Saccharopolyspora tripterygii]